jgi:hypothetical protein
MSFFKFFFFFDMNNESVIQTILKYSLKEDIFVPLILF